MNVYNEYLKSRGENGEEGAVNGGENGNAEGESAEQKA